MKVKPLITEKSMKGVSQNNYAFKVNGQTSKSQIKKAIEEEFKVNVIKVRTMNVKKTKRWKKAVVEIKKGQKIEGFGGEHAE